MSRQMEIPGTERKKIPALETAIEEYRSVRDSRMLLTEQEVKAKDKLKKLMEKHGLTAYLWESDDIDEDTEKPILFDVTFEAEEPEVRVRKHKEPKKGGKGKEEPTGSEA